MEPCKLSLAEETVEDVSHFVEEGHNIVMAHQSRLVGSGLRQVGDHGCQGVTALSIGAIVTRQNWPNGCMRVFVGWDKA